MSESLVSVHYLRPGIYIRLGLKWYEHPFLHNSFRIKSQQQIKVLTDLGLTEVAWVPEKSDPQAAELLSTELKDLDDRTTRSLPPKAILNPSSSLMTRLWEIKKDRIQRLRERNIRILRCEKAYQQTYGEVRKVIQGLTAGSLEAAEQAGAVVHGMVQSLLSEKEVMVHLMNVKGKDEGVYYHSLNTAILSLLIGKEYGLEPGALQDLGVGALFHDLGKHRIPKGLLYKRGPLTPAERQLIQLHPKFGEEMASRIKTIPKQATLVIRQHHETANGTGYPDGLKSNQISALTKVFSVANVYDNLCNRLNPEDSLTPHEALSHMYARLRDQLDPEVIALFIRCLGVYPPGTIVQLSNDLIGMVISVKPGKELRPSVLLYDPDIPVKEALIWNLDDDPEISVLRTLRPAQLEPEVYAYLNPRVRVTYFFDSPDPALRTQ